MHINSDVHWQVKIFDAKIGDEVLHEAGTDYDMIFDSGSSLSYIPKKSYEIFVKAIKKNHFCKIRKEDEMYECQCKGHDDDTFPKMSVKVGSAYA